MKSLPIFIFSFLNLAFSQTDSLRTTIHPKAQYFKASLGWNFSNTFINDPNKFLSSGNKLMSNTYFWSIGYEKGIYNNLFLDLGLQNNRHLISYGRELGNQKYYSSFEFNRSLDLNFGLGYRLFTRKKRHILNFALGGFSGRTSKNLNKGIVFQTFEVVSIKDDPYEGLYYNISFDNEKSSNFLLGLYVGTTLELRLSKDVRFFMNLQRRFGFAPLSKGEIILISNEIPFTQVAQYNHRGGSGLISFGLKIQVFRNKLDL